MNPGPYYARNCANTGQKEVPVPNEEESRRDDIDIRQMGKQKEQLSYMTGRSQPPTNLTFIKFFVTTVEQ